MREVHDAILPCCCQENVPDRKELVLFPSKISKILHRHITIFHCQPNWNGEVDIAEIFGMVLSPNWVCRL